MLELKIFSPQENGFVPEIKWNNEELKAAIAEKMEEYKGLVFTEETISEGKKDRANLNKLRGAIDDERKRVKKLCMPGTTKEIGARYLIASVVVDQEPNALVDLLDLANKGENPRVTKAMLDSYIDSEEVDIDELMEKTKDFLSKANATKKAVKEILKEYEEQMAKKQQAQEQ